MILCFPWPAARKRLADKYSNWDPHPGDVETSTCEVQVTASDPPNSFCACGRPPRQEEWDGWSANVCHRDVQSEGQSMRPASTSSVSKFKSTLFHMPLWLRLSVVSHILAQQKLELLLG